MRERASLSGEDARWLSSTVGCQSEAACRQWRLTVGTFAKTSQDEVVATLGRWQALGLVGLGNSSSVEEDGEGSGRR